LEGSAGLAEKRRWAIFQLAYGAIVLRVNGEADMATRLMKNTRAGDFAIYAVTSRITKELRKRPVGRDDVSLKEMRRKLHEWAEYTRLVSFEATEDAPGKDGFFHGVLSVETADESSIKDNNHCLFANPSLVCPSWMYEMQEGKAWMSEKESGSESIAALGRFIPCRRYHVSWNCAHPEAGAAMLTEHKIWIADDVPLGGLVRLIGEQRWNFNALPENDTDFCFWPLGKEDMIVEISVELSGFRLAPRNDMEGRENDGPPSL